jgi:hypothetical protein
LSLADRSSACLFLFPKKSLRGNSGKNPNDANYNSNCTDK